MQFTYEIMNWWDGRYAVIRVRNTEKGRPYGVLSLWSDKDEALRKAADLQDRQAQEAWARAWEV